MKTKSKTKKQKANKKRWNHLRTGFLCLAVLFLAGWFVAGQMQKAEAADGDYSLNLNGNIVTGTDPYMMRRDTLTAMVTAAAGKTYDHIEWHITDNNNGSIVEVTIPTNGTAGVEGGYVRSQSLELKARTAGTIMLYARVYDANNAILADLVKEVRVGYVISEEMEGISASAGIFGKLYENSEDNVLFLNLNATGYLKFVYEYTGKVTWTADAKGVVELVGADTGSRCKFTAVGTGHAVITASYNDADNKTQTDQIDVYVGPYITADNKVGEITQDDVFSQSTSIFTGINMSGNSAMIPDRVSWMVTNQNTSENVKDFFKYTATSEAMTVNARAGTYKAVFTVAGLEADRLEAVASEFLRKEVTFSVLAECKDTTVTLQVGDSFDLAEAFNLTSADFKTIFNFQEIDNTKVNVADGIINAIDETQSTPVTLKVTVNSGQSVYLRQLLLGSSGSAGSDGYYAYQDIYTITINIYKGYYLSATNISLYEGQTYYLSTRYGQDASKGTETWKSQNTAVATVDENGKVTAVKQGKTTITVTMKLSDGKMLTATCNVTVYTTADKISLNKDQVMLAIGDSTTIKAEFSGSVSSNLEWLIEDDKIATFEKISGDTVVVTGVSPGTTMLTAINPDNYVAAYCEVTVVSYIESISLDTTSVSGKVGQDGRQLKAIYQPGTATATELEWKSSDTSVATVDEYGYVTFVGAGTAIITVEPKLNPLFVPAAKCTVTLSQRATALSITNALTMEAGETKTVDVLVSPNNATTTIKWTSTNTSVATVDSKGKVTAVAPGVAYIVATTDDGLIDQCTVTVTQKASGIVLSVYNLRVAVGETYTVTATPNPSTSTEKTFTWTVKDANIASVTNEGKITGISAGSTIITVKNKSGDVEYVYVTVYDKAKGMTLNYTSRTIAKGSSFRLKPTFTPENVSDKTVAYSSSDETVATVGAKGKVTGKKGGSCIITAISTDGGYVATCLVKVVQPVTKVKLNKSKATLGVGKTLKLKATVTSNSSSNKKVKWTSSNTKVATVSSSGNVKAKKVGTCTIRATATDGSRKSASCKITVIRKVTGVSLNKAVLTIVVDRSKTLKATVRPKSATKKGVKWASDNEAIATVTSKGKITGISAGQCKVTATAKDGSKKSASCVIKVIEPIPITSIVVAGADMVLVRGTKQKINYTCVPSNNTDSISFSSDNKVVATVNGNGVVYGRRTGTATITIMTKGGQQALVNVRVIGLNKTSITMEQYDTRVLTVEGAAGAVTWDSSNESIATVANGVVTARRPGTAYIYARVNGVLLRCRVTVRRIS